MKRKTQAFEIGTAMATFALLFVICFVFYYYGPNCLAFGQELIENGLYQIEAKLSSKYHMDGSF